MVPTRGRMENIRGWGVGIILCGVDRQGFQLANKVVGTILNYGGTPIPRCMVPR